MTRFAFILLLSCSLAHAGLLVNHASLNHPIATVLTDASVTPTTNQTIVAAGWNGLRVWTGAQPVSEAYFDLYVSRNGGAAVKMRVFRWMGRIITATSGDSISLGTSDGRTLYVTPMYSPPTTEAITGTTGTANCDKAGPPLWSPTAPHVTLPANARAFQINSSGTELNLFLSEYDGTSWTPQRWLKLEANRSVTVRTSYRKIALANYAGSTVSITAPAGTTIGGSMATMSLTFPTVTGATRLCTNLTDLKLAMSNAVAGDEIVLLDGTYAMDAPVTQTNFVANIAAGNKGMEGITIRSQSGNRAACIIGGASANWNIDQTTGTNTCGFKDITWDYTGVSSIVSLRGGRWKIQNCRWTGNATGGTKNQIEFQESSTGPTACTADLLYCQADTSAADLFNFTGTTNSVYRVIDCIGFTTGTAADHQCLTPHSTAPAQVYSGSYYDAQVNVIAGGGGKPITYCFFTDFPNTVASRSGQLQDFSAFGITWSSTNSANSFLIGTNGYFVLSKAAVPSGYAASSGMFVPSSSVGTLITDKIIHNVMSANSGRGYFPLIGGLSFNFNMLSGFAEGIRLSNWSTGATNVACYGNTITSATTAINNADNTLALNMRNNACATNGTSINCTATSMSHMTTDYNVLDPTVDADFVAGANDTTGVNAALDSNLIPTASGNCDGNGDTSIVDYVGASDPFGLVLIYKATRISRGAREIPAVYSAAQLYPDLW